MARVQWAQSEQSELGYIYTDVIDTVQYYGLAHVLPTQDMKKSDVHPFSKPLRVSVQSNLCLIVLLSGYEQFGQHTNHRPNRGWGWGGGGGETSNSERKTSKSLKRLMFQYGCVSGRPTDKKVLSPVLFTFVHIRAGWTIIGTSQVIVCCT